MRSGTPHWPKLGLVLLALAVSGEALAGPDDWRREWPRTDFSRHAVDYEEVFSGGPPKDGIPAIDHPSFVPVGDVRDLPAREPVISIELGGVARAYPLHVMIWHEIVNDTTGGTPIAVTWCPLCNSSVVFDRRVGGRILSFGTTGKLRNSDLVMYDRETESWWQQFGGDCIVGSLLGTRLKLVPARVESLEKFRARYPKGEVLVPSDPGARPYGHNPYAGYDRSAYPFLFKGTYASKIPPLARVVSIGDEAWTLNLLERRRHIQAGELLLTWEPGQTSPLDTPLIDDGRDVGNVVVQRRTAHGVEDVVYDVSFAFAFHTFHPNALIHEE